MHANLIVAGDALLGLHGISGVGDFSVTGVNVPSSGIFSSSAAGKPSCGISIWMEVLGLVPNGKQSVKEGEREHGSRSKIDNA